MVVHYLHCDALVIRTVMARNMLEQILEDNGSSVNIIFRYAFDKMDVDHELTPVNTPLYGFIGDNIISRGRITLVVEIGKPSQIVLNFMRFLVVDNRLLTKGYWRDPP